MMEWWRDVAVRRRRLLRRETRDEGREVKRWGGAMWVVAERGDWCAGRGGEDVSLLVGTPRQGSAAG